MKMSMKKRTVQTWLYLCVATVVLGTFAHAAIVPDVEIRRDLNRVFTEELSVEGYPYQSLLREAAKRYGLPLPLVLAVARGESFFDPGAVSAKGAVGIMQVMPATAKTPYGISRSELFDPATNIDVGVHYLADQYERFQDPYLALAAYYCGPGGIDGENGTVGSACNEYVRYIHTHLGTITARAEGRLPEPEGELRKLVVTNFNNYIDARDFLNFVNPRLENLQLDLFRTEVQLPEHTQFQYQIIAAHGSETSADEICRQLKEHTGFSLCSKRR
jgi:soluble lytic murein transglycosylase-like protein